MCTRDINGVRVEVLKLLGSDSNDQGNERRHKDATRDNDNDKDGGWQIKDEGTD